MAASKAAQRRSRAKRVTEAHPEPVADEVFDDFPHISEPAPKDLPGRVDWIRRHFGREEAATFIAQKAFELSTTGMTGLEIGSALGVGQQYISRILDLRRKELSNLARRFNASEWIGRTLSNAKMHHEMAMRNYQLAKTDVARHRAHQAAIQANRDMTILLDKWGVFEVHRYQPHSDADNAGADIGAALDIADGLESLLQIAGPLIEDVEYEEA